MAKWKCKLCGFIYDEDEGLPDRGIEPGTPFSELSDAFKCPKCGVSKKMFKEVEWFIYYNLLKLNYWKTILVKYIQRR